MKFAYLFLVPFLAQANTTGSVFPADSKLPVELQQKVLEQVKAKCPRGLVKNGLTEESTMVREEAVDQGAADYFYTTTFRTTYYFDGMHPAFAFITVVSAQYAISNPGVDRFEVRSVTADMPELCN